MISHAFKTLATIEAQSLGSTAFTLAEIKHPLSMISEEEMLGRAQSAWSSIEPWIKANQR